MPFDYRNYPNCWQSIRKVLLFMADNRCEQCRVPDRAYIIRNPNDPRKYEVLNPNDGLITESLAFDSHVVLVILTIAHVNHDTHDNRPKNLRALCQRCHNVLDAQDRAKHRMITYAKRRAQGVLPLPFEWP